MNDLKPSLHPEFSRQYEEAQALHIHMVMNGYMAWELGPVCSRDHAYALKDLKEVVREFLRFAPTGPDLHPEYQRLKQAVHSQLNSKP